MGLLLKNIGLPLKSPEEFRENESSTPLRIPYFFYSIPNEILSFYNVPLKNSMDPRLRVLGFHVLKKKVRWGGGDVY